MLNPLKVLSMKKTQKIIWIEDGGLTNLGEE
jgi:hypothetical protein